MALLRQSGSGGMLPGCFEDRLPPYTRFVVVSRQYPSGRLMGRNLKSVPLFGTLPVSVPRPVNG